MCASACSEFSAVSFETLITFSEGNKDEEENGPTRKRMEKESKMIDKEIKK